MQKTGLVRSVYGEKRDGSNRRRQKKLGDLVAATLSVALDLGLLGSSRSLSSIMWRRAHAYQLIFSNLLEHHSLPSVHRAVMDA